MQQKTLDSICKLGFEPDTPVSGLLFTDRDYRGDSNVSFGEILIIHRAEELGASAVYFRRIEGGSSVPQLFIFDNSDGQFSLDDLIGIHKKIWSSGIVPLYYVFDNTEVKIFNSRKSVDVSKGKPKIDPFDSLSLTSKAHAEYEKYSASRFSNGSFWESEENRDCFKADWSSYNKLIAELRRIRKEFTKGQNGDSCNKLLVLSILVKYLEERKDGRGKHVLSQDYFKKFDGATSFCAVLRKNKGLKLFEDLAKEINGKIFQLTESEKREISALDQARLADFLDAKLDNQQYVFWSLYDFNYLPVELISRIYEEFIPNRKDITYTPTHLVNFMVDECMPVNTLQKNIKLIDVSCGSGIFLVAAFKRLAQWWQKKHFDETGEIKSPNIKILKNILSNSIYGIDIEPEAVRLAMFSLTLAVCEMLDPTKMWEELTQEKFFDLSENIITKDFFDFTNQSEKKFNLVIGNPPFNFPVKDENKKKEKELKDKYWADLRDKIVFDFEIPDNNFALLFLQQAMKLLKADGLLSFVMPSGPLLYNHNTLEYRRNFLNKYNVPQIFDFSCLSGILFSRNYPVSVIFAENKIPDDKDILHVVVKRTKTSKEELYFEIDKYDLHQVPKEIAKTEPLIWKANFLGSGHLYHLLNRFQKIRTLEKYLKDKKKYNDWYFAEGYAPKGELTSKPKKASWLTGKSWIPTENFTRDFIRRSDIFTETESTFYWTSEKNKKIFEAPHILIKETPSLPIAFYDDYLVFRHEIIGIHAPPGQKNELLKLQNNIKENKVLYKMLLLAMSGRAGISRSVETILKKDIMALPYPEDMNKLKLSRAEQIVCDDILEYVVSMVSEGENSIACTTNADSHTLKAFGKVFCDSLNSIYSEKSKLFYGLDYIESPSFICFPFAYGNSENPQSIPPNKSDQIRSGDLHGLLNNPQGSNVLYQRIISLYHKDMVFLIKPKTLRFWLKSIALRDANDVFADLVSSGY
jgi:hypothetical protein